MSCKHMRKVEDIDDLTDEQTERVKRIICSALCGGLCKKEYLENIIRK